MSLSESPASDATIHVDLGERSYPIVVTGDGGRATAHFGEFLRERLSATWGGKGCRRALIVSDENVKTPWADACECESRAIGLETSVATVASGEKSKSIEALTALYDRLIDLEADRHTLVVAVGGGVIGDLAGFAAASFNRGLPLVMVPTTLLSQVDSSVGGKTAVNHPRGKNLIGSFHQPIGVWIDLGTLRTLPDREFRSGLAEVLKYGVIADPEFFGYLEANAAAAVDRSETVLRHLVARSCRIKADVVEQDELEHTGLRAILNFGHTVAHAVENVAGYGAYLHGEAVALGMIAETRLAVRLGWVDRTVADRLEALVLRLGLPTWIEGCSIDDLLAAMKHDKKNRMGRIRFVLPRSLGRVELTDQPTDEIVRTVVSEMSRGPSHRTGQDLSTHGN